VNTGVGLPILILASSLLPGIAIFLLREDSHRLRSPQPGWLHSIKLGLVAMLLVGGLRKAGTTRPAGRSDPAGASCCAPTPWRMLLVTLSAVLWLFTTVYAIGYLEGSPHRSASSASSACASPPPWAWHWRATCSPSSCSTSC
jgi:multicomponent Na+:H+ antiporter subunit D